VHRILRLVLGLSLLPLLALGSYEAEGRKLADLLDWTPGQVIAEIGAGEGQMSFFAADRVGPAGHVYTTELDDKKLEHLKQEVARRKLQNITVLKADPIGTNLPDNCCSSIFMRRVYHHLRDRAATDAALLRALKPGGLVAVVDFAPHRGLPLIGNAPQNHSGHGIARNTLVAELSAAGFEITIQPTDWPTDGDYCVIARKPTATAQP
jgi:ubiquinone/menaquinone biosynthesis C-methylase UbiE